MPKVLIFAGANSILDPGMRFINADDIQRAEKLSDIEAGQKTLQLIDISISRKMNFGCWMNLILKYLRG